MIYLGADHAGFKLKEEIKKYLSKLGKDYVDLGNHKLDPLDDYPDYAYAVAQKVAETDGKGILICGSGIGMCIVANKVDGVRAALSDNVRDAELSRQHNNANILCLNGKEMTIKKAKEIIETWLKANYTEKERHSRRLNKIKKIEENN